MKYCRIHQLALAFLRTASTKSLKIECVAHLREKTINADPLSLMVAALGFNFLN